MREEDTIGDYLDDLRGRIQIKLARGGAPADPDTLRLICLAMALRVADPAGIRLLTKPLPRRLYPVLENMLAQVDRDFVREISELQDLIADAQEDPAWQAAIQQAVLTGIVPSNRPPEDHIEQLILELFVDWHEESEAPTATQEESEDE